MAVAPSRMQLNGFRILLLEDEPLLRRRIAAYFEKQEADVTAVKTIAEASEVLKTLDFDFAVLDINLPDGRSLSLLEGKQISSSIVTVVMTAEGGVASAVEAMRVGAADYLVKPFDLDELSVRLLRARRDRQNRRGDEFRRLQQAASDDSFFFGHALESLRTQLDRIIEADRRLQSGPLPPILIEGETGTGKTSLARWIHRHGPRAECPLIEVNCSALPESLVESELFGHERGAFTDAREARIGLLEAAEGGTVFLDELPSLSLAVQAKLLKAIEDHAIRRVGANRMVPIDARIIAATNADLRGLISAGKFREDLFHRLDLFRVRVPPLRERGDDIVTLAEVLAGNIAKRYGYAPQPIPETGRARLLAHSWPGNVRELAHEVERSLVFEEERLTFAGLPGKGRTPGIQNVDDWLSPAFRFPDSGFLLEEFIDRLIDKALAQADNNVSAAARLLGVSRDYVRYRVKSRTNSKTESDAE